jgi:hypothetical protein
MQQIVAKDMWPLWFINESLPSSPAQYDPEYQRKWEFEYEKVTRIDIQENHYVGTVPKKSISFSQHDLVEMIILSGICEAISLINLTMIQHFGSRIDTEFIISHLLSSKGYFILCDNLYKTWTNEQRFFLNKDVEGNDSAEYSCEAGRAALALLTDKKIIRQMQLLLPEHQKEQVSYLIDNKIIFNYIQELFSELA